jgi:hypothetical protein
MSYAVAFSLNSPRRLPYETERMRNVRTEVLNGSKVGFRKADCFSQDSSALRTTI